jgi:methionyl-tRNA synthetase
VFKTDPEAAAAIIRLGLNLVRFYAVLSAPFIPGASADLLRAMRSEGASWPEDVRAALSALPAGHAFDVPEVTFAKITDTDREDWATRFAGIRA